jgi:N-acetylglutamate synthase-like GNAT family acetyltransferase
MTEEELNKIVDFYEKYLGQLDRETIKEQLLDNLKYATVDYATDEKGGVIGLCRWNVTNNIAHILDLTIAPEWRKRGLGNHFLTRGLKLWKNVTHIEFMRAKKGGKRIRLIPVEYILKHSSF